ncbi:MAG TPA: ribose-phosphate pyrophosphokinase [Candidatus Hydrogenedentes bacterium]|nr:ribose-phosphate pyrophosphokinase [Candidatus Hydrogenedentota bacterium]HPG68557.1 ribose-phosphate pyrophosphokinase [Candidatus Hydrogenedentota bacterium]
MVYARELKVFSGNASTALTDGICSHLKEVPGEIKVDHFSDGEIRVQIADNIRGDDVFIINSTSPPVNDHMVELLIMIDAARRASAERVTAVMPYFGYARQDRKDRPRVAITAKLVANLLVAAGADRVLTVDLHSGQIQGFFDIPVDHLRGDVLFANWLRQRKMTDVVVVSPDMGSVKRAREVASRIDARLVIVDKRRPKENVAEVMNIIGDVEGMHAVIFDDMIDTAGTLVNAAEAVKAHGALDVIACATHPVLSGKAVQRLNDSVLNEVLVSDSIPLNGEAAASPKIKVISLAPLIGEAIRRIHDEESVSSLFE